MTTLFETLGQRIAGFDTGTISDQALANSLAAIIDTVGVTLGGANEPACMIQRRVAARSLPPGNALIFGTDIRTEPLQASLLNGTASHVLDYDDGNSTLGGHPSVMLVPPLVALAEDRGKSGRDLLNAYVVGFEAMISVARGANLYHYEKGWHPTTTLGIFGVAAGCASLIGLDAHRTTMALALCASMAAGVKANFGTMTKSLHVGQGTRNGLYAVLLAEAGYTASPGALEGRQGFLEVYNGEGRYDVAQIAREWTQPYAIETPGVKVKQYACCASTHGSVQAAVTLFRQHRPDPAEIAGVEILAHRRRLPHTDRPDPASALSGKFSIQYVVARALLHGNVTLGDFEGDAHLDRDVRDLMRTTVAKIDPAIPDEDQFRAEVRVTLRDGTVLAAPGQRLEPTPDELLVKFADCAGRALPTGRIASLTAAIRSLDLAARVSDVTRKMEIAGRDGPVTA